MCGHRGVDKVRNEVIKEVEVVLIEVKVREARLK